MLIFRVSVHFLVLRIRSTLALVTVCIYNEVDSLVADRGQDLAGAGAGAGDHQNGRGRGRGAGAGAGEIFFCPTELIYTSNESS